MSKKPSSINVINPQDGTPSGDETTKGTEEDSKEDQEQAPPVEQDQPQEGDLGETQQTDAAVPVVPTDGEVASPGVVEGEQPDDKPGEPEEGMPLPGTYC